MSSGSLSLGALIFVVSAALPICRAFLPRPTLELQLSDTTRTNKKVVVCVLTGGPCGGKSSCLDGMVSTLKKMGIEVYTIPEIPTILIANGAAYPGMDLGENVLLEFECNMIELQRKVEDTFIGIATSRNRPSVIICDRATLDVAAYLPENLWNKALQRIGATKAKLTERYDIVCHLVTAADGAEEFYTTTNNASRTETASEARELDRKTQSCWNHHPNFMLVSNIASERFKGKMNRAIDFITVEVKKILC